MENEQNINFTQTEVEALLDILNYFKEVGYGEFEDYVEIEMESVREKLNTFKFVED